MYRKRLGVDVEVVWRVKDDAERVLRQRHTFRARLDALARPSSDVDGAELIYGELVTNTVRYARGAVEVRLELSGRKSPVLVVRDHGPGVHRTPQPPDPYAESGRGLAIVESLAYDVAVHAAADGGTVVRAVLPITLRERRRPPVSAARE